MGYRLLLITGRYKDQLLCFFYIMSYKSKRKKEYPCIRCDEHVKANDHAVKCALCDLWVHKSCEKMNDETFSVLDLQNTETGQCFWSCKSCCSYALKFDKRMRDVEKRVQVLEHKFPNLEVDVETAKGDIESLKTTTSKLATNAAENQAVPDELATSIFEEIRERESRQCNIIIHNLPEPEREGADNKQRIQIDKDKVQELCDVMDAAVNIDNSARFAKRLGPLDEDSTSPRPLLVGFKTKDNRDAVLDKSSLLAEKDDPWCNVNVVMDLTKTQRKEEKNLRDEATQRNAELSEDAENWKWKVVGRRGERKVVKVSVTREEDPSNPQANNVRRSGRNKGKGQGRRAGLGRGQNQS